jgi:hypothetical protein
MFFKLRKDGGPESRVWGFFFVELKSLFSVVLLVFKGWTREVYHTHAFNSVSWVLWGKLTEYRLTNNGYDAVTEYRPSLRPIVTTRDNFHMVDPTGTAVVISFRGPWLLSWSEFDPATRILSTLMHGRGVVSQFIVPGWRTERVLSHLSKQTNEELAS